MAWSKSLWASISIALLVLSSCCYLLWAQFNHFTNGHTNTNSICSTQVDLGERSCGSWLDAEIPMTNRSNRPLTILDIPVPGFCGLNVCIRPNPSPNGRWTLPPRETQNVPCQIYVHQPEEFRLSIPLYVDDGGLSKVTIEIHGRGREVGKGGSHAENKQQE